MISPANVLGSIIPPITTILGLDVSISRDIRVFLEAHDLSKSLWAALRKRRAWIPDGLLEEQKLELKKLLDKEPDLLLIIGNHLFLLLLVSLYESGALNAPTRLPEILWDYLMPFQMMGIGFVPRYHSHHNTGESFLHRTKLIDRLKGRAEGLKQILGGGQVSEILFGRACLVECSNNRKSQHLLLTFQARPGSHEMNVIFLKLPLEASGLTLDVLKSLCKDRPFWGISDLALLTYLSERVDPEKGIDVLVATQRGIRGLWACDDRSSTWLPVGSIDYYTRRHETVTIVMSVTIREDPTLLQLMGDAVRKPPSGLEDSISVGLGLISAVFRNITPAKCHVILDTESQKFRLSVLDSETKDGVAQVEIEETADVLEVLRRPDFSCEPVVIDGKHYAWNRFTDIEFDEEVKALRPFVHRRDPFKIDSVLLPPKAESFQEIWKGGSLGIRVSHDYHVCPLRSRNPKSISKQSGTVKRITEHLQDVDGDPGQPESLFNESIYRHGACWRISFHPDNRIPEEIRELEQIRFTGPALETFLETGVISYLAQDGQWAMCDIQIPVSKDLPKEFRESIHLMRWRKERATYPGLYLLDGWIPEICRFNDRVEFRLVSELTPRRIVHTVCTPRIEMMDREHVIRLLREGMEAVLEKGGFSENSLMKQLAEMEMEDHLSLIEEEDIVEMQLDSVNITTDKTGKQVIEAAFVTSEGDYVSIQVTQWIHTYLDWTEMAGWVSIDDIEGDVEIALEGRSIDNDLVEKIIEEVKRLLQEKGVVIREP